MRAKPIGLVGVLVSSLVVPSGTAQQVHTVGERDSLQAAVDAAQGGDVLMISGVHPGPTRIEGKSLLLHGHGGGAEIQALFVEDLIQDQVVVLRGLRLTSFFPGSPFSGSPAIKITDCRGTVWVEDCEVESMFGIGADVSFVDRLILIRITAQGGNNFESWNNGTHGVGAYGSTIHAYESRFSGGPASAAPGAGNEHVSGGSGMRVDAGFLFASGSEFEGGSHYCDSASCGSNVGLGLYSSPAESSLGFTIDSAIQPGGWIGGFVNHTDIDATPCGLTMSSPVQEGESLEASLFGTPNSLALIGFSLSPRAFFVPPLAGSLLLDDPSLVYHALVLDEEGLGTLSLPFASLGGSVDAIQTFHQAGLLLPSLELQLCSGSAVLLLSSAI